jgi:hypothetical protein
MESDDRPTFFVLEVCLVYKYLGCLAGCYTRMMKGRSRYEARLSFSVPVGVKSLSILAKAIRVTSRRAPHHWEDGIPNP